MRFIVDTYDVPFSESMISMILENELDTPVKVRCIDTADLELCADGHNPNNSHGDNYEAGQYFGFQDGFRCALEEF